MTRMSKTILDILIIVNLVFIWGNSMLPGPESNKLSITVVEKAENVLGIERPTPHTSEDTSILVVRKAAHVAEFMCLGMLLALRLFSDRLMTVAAFVLCVCVASADEIIQTFTNRTASITDVLIDAAGAGAGILIILLIKHFIKKRKDKIKPQ